MGVAPLSDRDGQHRASARASFAINFPHQRVKVLLHHGEIYRFLQYGFYQSKQE